ncbi:MAG: hypothetical protein V2I43_24845 [Parvularcula sp.]|jgi:hypothetical protein|nr:hypothetical protein [Parvularcula sp.]
MFKLIMRAQVNWISGFGRYLDLVLAMALMVVAIDSGSWIWGLFAAIALASFIFDANGRFQRYVFNKSMTKAGVR